ncbi:MAG: complex I subunit 5 family protein [Lachnospiraceae bacterium]|nr:complex I subunit 5 family protein [Lachnospiraceae bacterium]
MKMTEVLGQICGMGLHFTWDGIRAVFVALAVILWAVATLFSREYFPKGERLTAFYLSWAAAFLATVGFFVSADFYTALICFEVLSFSSYLWVVQEKEEPGSKEAGDLYLAISVIGGLSALMGVFLLYSLFGTVEYSALYAAIRDEAAMAGVNRGQLYAAGICLMVGFGAKAGAFPIHIWLPKAHAVAPAPASAVLSGILTKVGIFGIWMTSLCVFWKSGVFFFVLLVLGIITMLTGAVLAIWSVDIKRTFACSSVSQIGFILTGISCFGLMEGESAVPLQGFMIHVMNHSIAKLVLFTVAGVIVKHTHSRNFNVIQGFGRKKTLLKLCYGAAALSLSGVVGFAGYASKTLLHEGITEYAEMVSEGIISAAVFGGMLVPVLKVVEILFLIAGGCTFAYMLKVFMVVFVEKNADPHVQQAYDENKSYLSGPMRVILAFLSMLFPTVGILGNSVAQLVGQRGEIFLGESFESVHVQIFSGEALLSGLISLSIGAIIYLFFIRKVLVREKDGHREYLYRRQHWFDLEQNIYRPLLLHLLPAAGGFVCGILDRMLDVTVSAALKVSAVVCMAANRLVDSVVVFLRRTLFKESPAWEELKEGNALTHLAGSFRNRMEDVLDVVFQREKPHKDYEHQLASGYKHMQETYLLISRSLSFGLLLFCLGLLLTVLYVLFF